MIYNNTLNNNVTSIQSRADIDGLSIEVSQATTTSTPAQIYNNTIHGGPQGRDPKRIPGAQVYGNTIEQGTVGSNEYTNDFSIYPWAPNQNVHNNTILPSQGRGISIDSSAYSVANTVVQANTITVIAKADNSEYNGCPLDGTYGVQYDDQPRAHPTKTIPSSPTQSSATVRACGSHRRRRQHLDEQLVYRKLLSGAASGVVAAGISIDSARRRRSRQP